MPVYKPPAPGQTPLPNWMSPKPSTDVGGFDLMGPIAAPAMAAEEGGGLFKMLINALRRDSAPTRVPSGYKIPSAPAAPAAPSAFEMPGAPVATLPGMQMSREALTKAVQEHPGLVDQPEIQRLMDQYQLKVQTGAPRPSTAQTLKNLPAPPSTAGGVTPMEAAATAAPAGPAERVAPSGFAWGGTGRVRGKVTEDVVREIRAWRQGEGAGMTQAKAAAMLSERYGLKPKSVIDILAGTSWSSVK